MQSTSEFEIKLTSTILKARSDLLHSGHNTLRTSRKYSPYSNHIVLTLKKSPLKILLQAIEGFQRHLTTFKIFVGLRESTEGKTLWDNIYEYSHWQHISIKKSHQAFPLLCSKSGIHFNLVKLKPWKPSFCLASVTET